MRVGRGSSRCRGRLFAHQFKFAPTLILYIYAVLFEENAKLTLQDLSTRLGDTRDSDRTVDCAELSRTQRSSSVLLQLGRQGARPDRSSDSSADTTSNLSPKGEESNGECHVLVRNRDLSGDLGRCDTETTTDGDEDLGSDDVSIGRVLPACELKTLSAVHL